MKNNKKSGYKIICRAALCMMISVFMILSTAVFSTAQEKKKTCEVVVLMDVSGSMNDADPIDSKTGTRVTLESMEAFPYAFKKDVYSGITLDIVIYNKNVHMLLNDVDVSNEVGTEQLTQKINELRSKKVDGFSNPYMGLTNIEAAMLLAEENLKDSSADIKAIVLFTDGKIELGEGSDKDEASEERTIALGKKLGDQGVRIYCIGLGEADEEFLNTLAANADGISNVYADKDAVLEAFRNIATTLAGGDPVNDITIKDIGIVDVKPDVPTTYEEDLYGEIIAEANICLSANVPINSLKITDPNGSVKASINLKDRHATATSPDCIIDVTSTRATINVKLVKPIDGKWNIEFYGEKEGSAKISMLSYYELEIACDIPTQINAGGTVSANASIFNKTTGVDILTKRVYSESTLSVYAIKKGLRNADAYASTSVDSSGHKFNYELAISEPGDYDVVFEVFNPRFNSKLVKTLPLHVNGASFVLNADSTEVQRGKGVGVTGQFFSGDAACEVVPQYLAEAEIVVSVSKEGRLIRTYDAEPLLDWMGKAHNYGFDQLGSHTFTAQIKRVDEPIASNELTVNVLPSVISVVGDFENIVKGTFNGSFETVIPLNGVFEDSDEDTVTVNIAEASEGITAEMDQAAGQLVIRADKSVKGSVKLLASDGYGAEENFEISVNVKSMMDALLPLIITAGVVIVLIILALVLVRKNSIISFSFSVTLEKNRRTYTFNIQNYRYRKDARPKVNLKNLIDRCGSCVNGNEDDAREIFAQIIGNNVELKGKPFKKEFVIYIKGRKTGEYRRNSERDIWITEDDMITFGPVQ